MLSPRQETEILVEKALSVSNDDYKVLDLCTGSGAIAIAVKKQINTRVVASDISKRALAVASKNAQLNGVNIDFVCSNLFAKINEKYVKKYVKNR